MFFACKPSTVYNLRNPECKRSTCRAPAARKPAASKAAGPALSAAAPAAAKRRPRAKAVADAAHEEEEEVLSPAVVPKVGLASSSQSSLGELFNFACRRG